MNAPVNKDNLLINKDNPDKPLVVKCAFNRNNKKITFDSAQRCTYDRLRQQILKGFFLSASSPIDICYKDDDGEKFKISTDYQITDAIRYFHSATDDAPASSASSIFSSRSFGNNKKITLRLQIELEYDGPSLSDNGSIVSMDEYRSRDRGASEGSFSFSAGDPDNDFVTVSSRATGRFSARRSAGNRGSSPLPGRASQLSSHFSWDAVPRSTKHAPTDPSARSARLSGESSWDAFSHSTRHAPYAPSEPSAILPAQQSQNPFDDRNGERSQNDVFERLRQENDNANTHYDPVVYDQRGITWIKEQNERAKRSLGVFPSSSASDESSSSLLEQEDQVGDLSLQRGPDGKYYYMYDLEASQSQAAPEDGDFEIDPSIDGGINGKPRPTSRQLNWLVQQQNATARQLHLHHLDLSLDTIIPEEVRQDMPVALPREEDLTCCSRCGTLLDNIKYVCYTCGEKEPSSLTPPNKGKERDSSPTSFTYPPAPHQTSLYTSPQSPSTSSFSNTFVGSQLVLKRRPLPPEPSADTSSTTLVSSVPRKRSGFELCPFCLEEVGHIHALESINELGLSPTASNLSSYSIGEAAAQRRRAAPKQKGQLRHAFVEKMWGHGGWNDLVHTDKETEICSGCSVTTTTRNSKMYKCASCQQYQLCRACYSQVHGLHPRHTFLVLRGKPSRSPSNSELLTMLNDSDEQSNVHRGVECLNCRMEIVGARFHCAECDAVDICSKCESAGLPGNIDSADGGHVSSHILIKIPFPLHSSKVQSVSRKARNLWTRDPANVNRVEQSKAKSEISSYARTVIGIGNMHTSEAVVNEDHGIICDACKKSISGVRFQCANCPALQSGYNLCSSCEKVSYSVHNPMHAFFKLPRPVDQPIQSSVPLVPELYKLPAGPSCAVYDIGNPTGYLHSIIHPGVFCDCCVTEIQGAWFHCAYCGKDLCSTCESVDDHNDTHVFLVLKAPVDMQTLRRLLVDMENPLPIIKAQLYIPN